MTNFDRAFEDAVRGFPQVITKEGRPKVVLMSFDQWIELRRLAGFGADVDFDDETSEG